MGEEVLRDNLSQRQVKDLVARLNKDINFRIIRAGKNLQYVGLQVHDGPPEVKALPRDQAYIGLGPTQFDGFKSPTYVGVIRKSSVSLMHYKDSRDDLLKSYGYPDTFRIIVDHL